MKPAVAKVNHQNHHYQNKEEKLVNGKIIEKINGITTTTSGGVTIVKLNMAPVPVIPSSQLETTSITNGLNGHEKKTEGKTSSSGDILATTNGKIGTNGGPNSGLANGVTSPPHTG